MLIALKILWVTFLVFGTLWLLWRAIETELWEDARDRWVARKAENLSKFRSAVVKEQIREKKREQKEFMARVGVVARKLRADGHFQVSSKEIAAWYQERGYEVTPQRVYSNVNEYLIKVPPVTDKELSDIMLK